MLVDGIAILAAHSAISDRPWHFPAVYYPIYTIGQILTCSLL